MYERHVEMFVERKDCEEDVAGLEPIMLALFFRRSTSLFDFSIVEYLETHAMRHIVLAWIKVCLRSNIHQNV